MYDPTIGRWLSEDPIQFAAGDVNLYRFVQNSAPNWRDPTGLDEQDDLIQAARDQLLLPYPPAEGGGSSASGGQSDPRQLKPDLAPPPRPLPGKVVGNFKDDPSLVPPIEIIPPPPRLGDVIRQGWEEWLEGRRKYWRWWREQPEEALNDAIEKYIQGMSTGGIKVVGPKIPLTMTRVVTDAKTANAMVESQSQTRPG